jgi:hypothetical protein
MSKLAQTIVFDIIDELTDRKGFDALFFDLDKDTRNELDGKLIGIVDENIEREAQNAT